MKYVIFSDLHGNQFALEAMLNQLNEEKIEYDRMIFCGDILGYYYGQEEIVDILLQMDNLLAVRGNHDQYGIDISESKKDAYDMYPKYGHSYGMTSPKVLDYVRGLPLQIEFEDEGKKYCILHGTPYDVLEGRQYPADDIPVEVAECYQKYDVVISGHTHFRMDRVCGRCRIINPGSLGQQRDGLGFVYAIYDSLTQELEYKNITFDIEALEGEINKYDKDLKKLSEILHRGEK